MSDRTADVEGLASEIRRVDGEHSLAASELAEALLPWLATRVAALVREAKAEVVSQRNHAMRQRDDERKRADDNWNALATAKAEGAREALLSAAEAFQSDRSRLERLTSGQVASILRRRAAAEGSE